MKKRNNAFSPKDMPDAAGKRLKMKVRRILIVYWDGLGDVLVTIPFLGVLKKIFPRAEVTYVAGGKGGPETSGLELLKGSPYVTHLIRSSPSILARLVKQAPYDLSIDLCGNSTSKLITKISGAGFFVRSRFRGIPYVFYYSPSAGIVEKVRFENNLYLAAGASRIRQLLEISRVFGIKYPGFALPQIRLSQAERGFGKKYLRKLKGGNAGLSIIVHPGGRNPFRLWEIKNHVALCDKIIEKYQADVFIAYSEDERSFAEKIMRGSRNKLHSICIKPIRGYSSVISAGDLFISTDGGPLQIALALGVPCIGIFRRRLNAEYWYDYRSRNNLFACFVRQIRRSSAPKENIQRIMSESKKVIPREVDLVFEKVARALKRKIRA